MASSLPTRLFKLDAAAVRLANNDTDIAKIPLGQTIENQDIVKLQSCNYCAVSHVWGQKPPSFDVANIPWKVPISSKEKFIFVLKTCERRGYSYVWMDLLCIDQTRGSPAPAEEMPKMHQYYKNAHATIVFGLDWKNFASLWAKAEKDINDWNGDRDKVIDPNWDGFGSIDAFIAEGWFWRVWTLQEAVIPSTTTPLGIEATDPAPYTSARLLTPDGNPINLASLCDTINWTYVALGKLPSTTPSERYDWIHPGAGIVNDHEAWYMMGILNATLHLGPSPLHPVDAMLVTKYRNTTHAIDRLKGVYALIDPYYHNTLTDPDAAFKDTAKKYIDKKEGGLLVSMGVYEKPTMTWAAMLFPGAKFGAFVPDVGEYPLIAATIMENESLDLTVSGVCNVSVHGEKTGDGSGELEKLVDKFISLQSSSYDVSSIVALLNLAINRAQMKPIQTPETINDIKSLIDESVSNANRISSALRSLFSAWDRCIVLDEDNKTAYLAWLPLPLSSGGYSLLWSIQGSNDWVVVVEGHDVQKEVKKVGVAFVHSEAPVGSQTNVIIV